MAAVEGMLSGRTKRVSVHGAVVEVPARVRAAWRALDGNLECQGMCVESCGPWVASRAEGAVLESAAGKPCANGMCPYLQGTSCSVHDVRPTICRLWGQVEGLTCRYGCRPKRVLSQDEAMHIIEGLGPTDWSPWPELEAYHRALDRRIEGYRDAAGEG